MFLCSDLVRIIISRIIQFYFLSVNWFILVFLDLRNLLSHQVNFCNSETLMKTFCFRKRLWGFRMVQTKNILSTHYFSSSATASRLLLYLLEFYWYNTKHVRLVLVYIYIWKSFLSVCLSLKHKRSEVPWLDWSDTKWYDWVCYLSH